MMLTRFDQTNLVVRLALLAALLDAKGFRGEAWAQSITVDGRLGPAQTLAGPNYVVGAALGRQVGGNLFHSFGTFGLKGGETATFSGPASVGNVIGRVTGGSASSINGAIRSTIPAANLYLVNPAGVVFGPNASVDVGGSFHASSADYLRMRDGARFQAANPDASTLSAAPPEAFGFLSASPQPVTVNGSQLAVMPRNTLGMVGGPVTISGGLLYAPSGTVRVASAAGPGEVPVNPHAGPAPTIARSGRVQVSNASINVNGAFAGADGGSIYIRAGDLSVGAASIIEADNRAAKPGAVLSLHADRTVVISDRSTVRTASIGTEGAGHGPDISISTAAGGTVTLDSSGVVTSTSTRTGDGGSVAINTGALTLRNGAALVSLASDRANGGPISVTADSVLLDGADTSLVSLTTWPGPSGADGRPTVGGTGGSISLNSGTITVRNGASVQATTTGTGAGGAINAAAGSLLLDGSGAKLSSETNGAALISRITGAGLAGAGGSISLSGGTLTVQNNAAIQASTSSGGVGGSIRAALTGNATVTAGAQIQSNSTATGGGQAGDAGPVTLAAQDVTIRGGQVTSNAPGATQENAVAVNATGDLVLDARQPGSYAAISSAAAGKQSEGPVLVTAQNVTLFGNSFIGTAAPLSGVNGAVTVTAQGNLTLDGRGSNQEPTISRAVGSDVAGPSNARAVNVSATNITLLNAVISGPAADVGVTAKGALTLDQGSLIEALSPGGANASKIRVTAEDLTLAGGSRIVGEALSTGRAADILVNVPGVVSINGTGSQVSSLIISTSQGSGNAGNVMVNAGALTLLRGGLIASIARASGNAGEVALNVGGVLTIDGAGVGGVVDSVSSEAPRGSSGSAGTVRVNAGSISVLNGAYISSSSDGTGAGGSVLVSTPGALLLDSRDVVNGGGIVVEAFDARSGNAGTATVNAGSVVVQGGAEISTSTAGTGRGGGVTINAGALTISRGGQITSLTRGSGNAGEVALNVGGAVTIDGAGGSSTAVGSDALSGSSGSAGLIRVNAGDISVLNGGVITSSTHGLGAGGSVLVTTPGALLLDGRGGGIAAEATGAQSGDAGTIVINAGSVAVQGRATITSSTTGPGRGGDVTVNTPALTVSNAGSVASSTAASGNAGEITLNIAGPLLIDGAGRGSFANGVSSAAEAGSSGSAGSVRVNAGSLAVLDGGTITSSTAGTGRGGSVLVTSPGAVLLDGGRDTGTAIAASATGPQSGNAGPVTVNASTVTVQGGAQIASSTAGLGRGGDVTVNAASAIRLSSPGPQVSATAARTGDAGSVAVAAPQVFLRDGASISTAAQSANGGNITVGPGNLLYLQRSAITTSVGGALGNGGNIAIAPQLVVLDRSVIQANAVGGNGGSVSVQAEQLVSSFDSAITATSQRGVSGEILVAAQPLNLNGSLVVLASDLRAAAALLREGCAARGASPRSSLVVAGRGGQRQGLDATLPALYFVHRPVRDGGQPTLDASAAPERTSLSLSSPCG